MLIIAIFLGLSMVRLCGECSHQSTRSDFAANFQALKATRRRLFFPSQATCKCVTQRQCPSLPSATATFPSTLCATTTRSKPGTEPTEEWSPPKTLILTSALTFITLMPVLTLRACSCSQQMNGPRSTTSSTRFEAPNRMKVASN